ncbi:hypothetical protein BJ165DRAFT_875750 [Panaeolus papilionaceus]|nr:hypothetical protein BJ165DRAFT_875750 [Panaeolus papilionaceus]
MDINDVGSIKVLYFDSRWMDSDYPSFYTHSYTFWDHDVLHLKHLSRFFRLANLFSSSTHLPVALLASFIKRLSRLPPSAPPAAILMVIPFNLYRLEMTSCVDVHDP